MLEKQHCIHCGHIFLAPKHRKQKYCSHDCYIAHKFGTDTWENLTCQSCGQAFRSRKRPDRPPTRCCSRACYHRLRNGMAMPTRALEAKAHGLAKHFRTRVPTPTTQAVLDLLSHAGISWQREVPIGRWVADILCTSHRIVIEIDGRRHKQRHYVEHDARRDADLQQKGFSVIRIEDCHRLESPNDRIRWQAQEEKLRCAFAGLI